jgi:hypothetical protein
MLTTMLLLAAMGQQAKPKPTPPKPKAVAATNKAVQSGEYSDQLKDVVQARSYRRRSRNAANQQQAARDRVQAGIQYQQSIELQRHQMQQQQVINQTNSVALEAQNQQLQAQRLAQMARMQTLMERQAGMPQQGQPQQQQRPENIYEMQQRLYGNR